MTEEPRVLRDQVWTVEIAHPFSRSCGCDTDFWWSRTSVLSGAVGVTQTPNGVAHPFGRSCGCDTDFWWSRTSVLSGAVGVTQTPDGVAHPFSRSRGCDTDFWLLLCDYNWGSSAQIESSLLSGSSHQIKLLPFLLRQLSVLISFFRKSFGLHTPTTKPVVDRTGITSEQQGKIIVLSILQTSRCVIFFNRVCMENYKPLRFVCGQMGWFWRNYIPD